MIIGSAVNVYLICIHSPPDEIKESLKQELRLVNVPKHIQKLS